MKAVRQALWEAIVVRLHWEIAEKLPDKAPDNKALWAMIEAAREIGRVEMTIALAGNPVDMPKGLETSMIDALKMLMTS